MATSCGTGAMPELPAKKEPPGMDLATVDHLTSCVCCRHNFLSLKFHVFLDSTNSRAGLPRQDFNLMSHPKTLPCVDCETVKARLTFRSDYSFVKDAAGFIHLTIGYNGGMALLKDSFIYNLLVLPKEETK